jgi:hypothetical protein
VDEIGDNIMIEPIKYYTGIVAAIGGFLGGIVLILKAIEELMKTLTMLPEWIFKFLVYGLTLVIPNTMIVWYFFYLAGFYPYRLSEPRFFLTIVVQPAIGVSLYAYLWGRLLYPWLKGTLSRTKPQKPGEEENPSQSRNKPSSRHPLSGRKKKHHSQAAHKLSREGVKK